MRCVVGIGNGAFNGGFLLGSDAADEDVVKFDIPMAVPLGVVVDSLGASSSGDSLSAGVLLVVVAGELGSSLFAVPLAADALPLELVAVVRVFFGVVHSGEGFKDTMCK